MKKSIFLLLVLCILSCRERIDDEHLRTIYADSLETIHNLDSNLAVEKTVIPLETTDSSILSGIKRIRMNNRLLVIEDYTENLFLFDGNGRFLRHLSSPGPARNEYTHLMDFYIDEAKEHIALVDDIVERILYFDYNGNFLTSSSLPENIIRSGSNITYIGGDSLLVTNSMTDNTSYNFSIIAPGQDTAVNILPFFYSGGQNVSYSEQCKASYNGKNLFLTADLSDTIYTLSSGSVTPYLVYQGHLKHVTSSFVEDNKTADVFTLLSTLHSKGYSEGLSTVYATTSHILFKVSAPSPFQWILYDQGTTKAYAIAVDAPFLPYIKDTYQDFFVCGIDADEYEELTGKAMSLEANPVVVLIRLR
jgi:hypothetical protein